MGFNPYILSSSPQSSSNHTAQRRTFAQAVNNSFDISIFQLHRPCVKGEAMSIKISEEEYRKGLDGYKMNLHGRLILSKEDKPIKFNDLKEKLAKLWKSVGQWKIIPLGIG